MNGQPLNNSDPRANREVIDQVISYADLWAEYRKEHVDYAGYDASFRDETFESEEYKRLLNYLNSLTEEQLDALYCAYELGAGYYDDFKPREKKIYDEFSHEGEDEEYEEYIKECNGIKRFNTITEWIDFVVQEFPEDKRQRQEGIDENEKMTPKNFSSIYPGRIKRNLRKAEEYLFDYFEP